MWLRASASGALSWLCVDGLTKNCVACNKATRSCGVLLTRVVSLEVPVLLVQGWPGVSVPGSRCKAFFA